MSSINYTNMMWGPYVARMQVAEASNSQHQVCYVRTDVTYVTHVRTYVRTYRYARTYVRMYVRSTYVRRYVRKYVRT